MVSRNLAWSIVATALALTGCGDSGPAGDVFPERDFVCPAGEAPPCETTEPVTTDDQRTREPGTELNGETRTFIVNALTVPDGADGTAAGFNLDGIDSGNGGGGETCEDFQPDYLPLTTHDPDQVGVDNSLIAVLGALQGIVDFDVNASLEEQLASGSLLLLVQVSGIDSLQNDPEIEMQLMLGELPDGATLEFDGTGAIAADQTFDVAMALGTPVKGDILDGRVAAQTSGLTLRVDTGDIALDLQIITPEVRFNITGGGLDAGQIGGVLNLDQLVTSAAQIPQVAEFCDGDPECPAARDLLGIYADVNPSSADPEVCEALSVGIAFSATTANVN